MDKKNEELEKLKIEMIEERLKKLRESRQKANIETKEEKDDNNKNESEKTTEPQSDATDKNDSPPQSAARAGSATKDLMRKMLQEAENELKKREMEERNALRDYAEDEVKLKY